MLMINQILEKINSSIAPVIDDEIIVCATFQNFKIGLDMDGCPYFFFKSTLSSRKYGTFSKVGFKAEFFQKLDLIDENGVVFSEIYDYLKVAGTSKEEIEFTIRIMAVLIEDLSFEYNSEKLKVGLERIIRILKNRTKISTTTLQGLLGELLFLYYSDNTTETYLGWRSSEFQKLDFLVNDTAFEIKTSKGNRIIMVEYNQVYNNHPIEKINFVSYVINSEGSDNLILLMYLIFEKLPVDYKYDFEEKFYCELGDKILEVEEFKFDMNICHNSNKMLGAIELPISRIDNLHRSVTSIKYSIDLDKM
jgi:hypothetical protein